MSIKLIRIAEGGNSLNFKAIVTDSRENIKIYKRWELETILQVSQVEYIEVVEQDAATAQ